MTKLRITNLTALGGAATSMIGYVTFACLNLNGGPQFQEGRLWAPIVFANLDVQIAWGIVMLSGVAMYLRRCA